jgi:hypothetical protein
MRLQAFRRAMRSAHRIQSNRATFNELVDRLEASEKKQTLAKLANA